MSVRQQQRGFVLIVLASSIFLLLAFMGLAFDMGRIYIARNEAQLFTDAAAMAAANQLDGTAAGLDKARAAVARLPNRWNLGMQTFQGVTVEFGAEGTAWEKDPKTPESVVSVRVTAPSNDLDIVFLRAVGGPESFRVAARSAASSNPVRLTE